MIYFITVNYRSSALLARLQASLMAETAIAWRWVIVNNSPEDRAVYQWASDRTVILETGENCGFGGGCNAGLHYVFAQDPQAIAWLINPDAWLGDRALSQAQQLWESQPPASILGTVVLTPEGQPWFGGGFFDPARGEIHALETLPPEDSPWMPTPWVSGCSLMLQLGRFDPCPQFDPAYFLYYEDVDFCRRYAEQGHTVGLATQVQVIHAPSSVTSRNARQKFRYSTESYLLTLARYAHRRALWGRSLRLGLKAIALLPLKPAIALGKLQGLWMSGRRALKL